MMTVFESIRQHLWERVIGGYFPDTKPDLSSLQQTEWDDQFVTLMRNRKIAAAIRYGLRRDRQAKPYDLITAIEKHLAAYLLDSNTEHMVDIANYALEEFSYHPDRFNPTDEHSLRANRLS